MVMDRHLSIHCTRTHISLLCVNTSFVTWAASHHQLLILFWPSAGRLSRKQFTQSSSSSSRSTKILSFSTILLLSSTQPLDIYIILRFNYSQHGPMDLFNPILPGWPTIEHRCVTYNNNNTKIPLRMIKRADMYYTTPGHTIIIRDWKLKIQLCWLGIFIRVSRASIRLNFVIGQKGAKEFLFL